MNWIYLASAIFGGSFLIPMILGGLASDMELDVDGDVDMDMDVDMDVDVDVDMDVDALDGVDSDLDGSTSMASAGLDASQAIVGSLLSFRSIVFFATFFGAAGLVFGALGYGVIVTFITALVLGMVAAVANSVLFGLLKSSETTSQIGERTFQGRPASVTVPIERGRRGRIRLDLSGQPHYLVAESFDQNEEFEPGHPVVVIELEDGIAKVASLLELE